jgi:hypothetical protein
MSLAIANGVPDLLIVFAILSMSYGSVLPLLRLSFTLASLWSSVGLRALRLLARGFAFALVRLPLLRPATFLVREVLTMR